MEKRMKRIAAFVLALALIVTALPTIDSYALSYSGSASYKSGKYYTALTNVKLTGNQRTDIVNVAKSQIGYQEGASSSQLSGTVRGSKNYTEYGRWYGIQDMWCAMFVSWCAARAGVSTSIVPKHSYTPTGLQWFKDRGRAYSRASVASGKYTPKAGDIIYFKSARNSNPTNHIGIVTKYSNGTVYTIEGNTSSATISTNGGAVAAKSYSISNTYIVYICCPAYKNTSTPSTPSTPTSSLIPSNLKSVVFDASYYAAKYSDLKSAYGTDATKLYNHFINYGIKEGRTASPYFDVTYYVNNNSDLKKAFGTDYVAAMKHYVNTGINEPSRVTAAPVNLGDSFVAKISYTSTLNLSLSSNNVITYQNSDKPAQQWKFIRQSDGSYKIVNQKNGYCLDVANGSKASKANVGIVADNGTKAQRWFIYKKATDKYVLRPACSSTCALDVADASKEALTNVRTYTYNGSSAQTFNIKKLTQEPANLGADFCAKISTTTDKRLSLSSKNVILYRDSNAPAQLWRFIRQSDGSYKIVNQKTGECLDVQGGGSAAGTNVQIYKSNNQDAQRWFIYGSEGKYTLVPKCATNCALDVTNGSSEDLTNIQIYTKNDSAAQKFKITKLDYFEAVKPADIGTNVYYKITASSGKNLSLSDTNVILYTPSTAKAQQWKFVRQSDGSYKIINQKDGVRCLDVASGSSASGANVQIYNDNGSNAQRWFIYLKEGRYVLRPACAAKCVLDVKDGASADLTNIQTYTFNASSAQLFRLTAIQ